MARSPVTCAYCKGTGRDPNGFITIRPCPVCHGKGKVPFSSLVRIRKSLVRHPEVETEPRIMLQVLYNCLVHVNDKQRFKRGFSSWTPEKRIAYIRHLARVYTKKTGGIVKGDLPPTRSKIRYCSGCGVEAGAGGGSCMGIVANPHKFVEGIQGDFCKFCGARAGWTPSHRPPACYAEAHEFVGLRPHA